MLTCVAHKEEFRNQRLLENHYIRKHLLDSPDLEAFIEKYVNLK